MQLLRGEVRAGQEVVVDHRGGAFTFEAREPQPPGS
jgi:hypothetical protein